MMLLESREPLPAPIEARGGLRQCDVSGLLKTSRRALMPSTPKVVPLRCEALEGYAGFERIMEPMIAMPAARPLLMLPIHADVEPDAVFNEGVASPGRTASAATRLEARNAGRPESPLADTAQKADPASRSRARPDTGYKPKPILRWRAAMDLMFRCGLFWLPGPSPTKALSAESLRDSRVNARRMEVTR